MAFGGEQRLDLMLCSDHSLVLTQVYTRQPQRGKTFGFAGCSVGIAYNRNQYPSDQPP